MEDAETGRHNEPITKVSFDLSLEDGEGLASFLESAAQILRLGGIVRLTIEVVE